MRHVVVGGVIWRSIATCLPVAGKCVSAGVPIVVERGPEHCLDKGGRHWAFLSATCHGRMQCAAPPLRRECIQCIQVHTGAYRCKHRGGCGAPF